MTTWIYFMCKARAAGVRQVALKRPCLLFHQPHPRQSFKTLELLQLQGFRLRDEPCRGIVEGRVPFGEPQWGFPDFDMFEANITRLRSEGVGGTADAASADWAPIEPSSETPVAERTRVPQCSDIGR